MNIVLTGGHTGIGLELLKRLIADGHGVVLVLRNRERAAVLPKGLHGHAQIQFAYGDLSERDDIARLGRDIARLFPHVDALFNNAGVLLDGLYTSPQGNEMHLEVNTLAPYHLTQSLTPLLAAAPDGLVVNTSTNGLAGRSGPELGMLLRPTSFRKLFGQYMQSKYALLLLMNYVAAHESRFRIVNANPGPNRSKMTAGSGMPAWLRPLSRLFFPKPSKGAGLLYEAAFGTARGTGLYLDGGRVRAVRGVLTERQAAALLAR